MTGPDIRAAREALGMTQASFAFWLGQEGEHGRRKIRRWEDGQEQITGPAARAIKLALALKRLMEAHGDDWSAAMAEAQGALGQRSEPAPSHSIGSRQAES